jgi:hypothetical protein
MRVFRTIGAVACGILGIVVAVGLLFWWEGRRPERPASLPPNAIYIESGVVPFKLKSTPGRWLGCWYDANDQFDHCKVTNENGWLEFEDVFLPSEGQITVSQSDLVLDIHRTGTLWTGSYEKGITVPVIYLTNGQILLPRTIFEKAKRDVQAR